MNPFEMALAIIIVMTIGKLVNTKLKANAGYAEDEDGNPIVLSDPNAARLSEEVKSLRERVQVLEKIATDDRGGRELSNEIEKLRDR